jgi:hypothetical protein
VHDKTDTTMEYSPLAEAVVIMRVDFLTENDDNELVLALSKKYEISQPKALLSCHLNSVL